MHLTASERVQLRKLMKKKDGEKINMARLEGSTDENVRDHFGGEVDSGWMVKCLLKFGREFRYYSVGNWET